MLIGAAELLEERGLTKRNTSEFNSHPTQSGSMTMLGFSRVRKQASRDKALTATTSCNTRTAKAELLPAKATSSN